jgi:hypothetical protein
MDPRRRSLATLIAVVCVAGCTLIGDPAPLPYPGGCTSLGFSVRRCAGIVAYARAKAGTPFGREPLSVGLLRAAPDSADLGRYEVARVVFGLADGSSLVVPVECVGVPTTADDAVCGEPHLAVASTVSHDVPCAGEPPAGCASPIVPDPAAVAAARPLRLPTLDVPIDAIGHHELEVGAVGLPNGYVTRIDARVVNDQPDDLWIRGAIHLELRPSDPTHAPFGDVYERPLYPGVEEAILWLVFDVTEASSGAVLHLADLVVE